MIKEIQYKGAVTGRFSGSRENKSAPPKTRGPLDRQSIKEIWRLLRAEIFQAEIGAFDFDKVKDSLSLLEGEWFQAVEQRDELLREARDTLDQIDQAESEATAQGSALVMDVDGLRDAVRRAEDGR